MSAPKIAVAQLGARRHYAIPAILHSAGWLDHFYTDVCAEVWWLRLARRALPRGMQPAGLRRLLGRRVADVPPSKIRCMTSLGLGRVLRRGRQSTPGEIIRHHVQSNRQFGRRLAARGLDGADTVYAFNGAALEVFRYGKERGMRTILEQTSAPIAYDERLLAEERSRWPGWEPAGASEAEWRPMHERERFEWELADVILCGSQYVADAVAAEGGPASRCKVVPYAFPREFENLPPRGPRMTGPLRVLYIGTLQLRKGVQYLIETARLLKGASVEIRLVGPPAVSGQALEELNLAGTVVGPVPRAEIRGEYNRADVFVLPTLSEGSANVSYEALASGLPVITTPNAGSVVRDEMEGYLVPTRSPEALADRIARLAVDRDALQQMSMAAASRAREFTREHYSNRLICAIAPDAELPGQPIGAAAA